DLEKFLGKTRIIQLRDCPDEELDAQVPKVTLAWLNRKAKEPIALSALSIFRWGFNHAMASLMLNSPALGDYKGTWGNIHEFLRGLQRTHMLRYGQGWYPLPRSLRDQLYHALPERKRAEYHLAAGIALAPYTMDSAAPSLAFDRAFL